MSQVKTDVQDVKLEQFLGNLLRTGVLLAAVIVLSGGIAYLVRFGMLPAEYRDFRGEPPQLCSLTEIVANALTGESRGVIQLGLLLLVATPVARVAFSVIAFAREQDVKYVFFTLIVLALLLCGLFLGVLDPGMVQQIVSNTLTGEVM